MMSPTKASKLLRDYKANNYNAYKTLVDNGYSELTAKKKAKRTLQTANEVIQRSLQLEPTDIKTQSSNVLDILGVTEEEVKNQLKEIAFNDRDYTNALKVLSVMSKQIGVDIVDPNSQSAPSVNITVEEVHTKDNAPTPSNQGAIYEGDSEPLD